MSDPHNTIYPNINYYTPYQFPSTPTHAPYQYAKPQNVNIQPIYTQVVTPVAVDPRKEEVNLSTLTISLFNNSNYTTLNQLPTLDINFCNRLKTLEKQARSSFLFKAFKVTANVFDALSKVSLKCAEAFAITITCTTALSIAGLLSPHIGALCIITAFPGACGFLGTTGICQIISDLVNRLANRILSLSFSCSLSKSDKLALENLKLWTTAAEKNNGRDLQYVQDAIINCQIAAIGQNIDPTLKKMHDQLQTNYEKLDRFQRVSIHMRTQQELACRYLRVPFTPLLRSSISLASMPRMH